MGKPSGLAALRTAKTHARIRAHAFDLVVTHRCARCGWASSGPLGETLPAFEAHDCAAPPGHAVRGQARRRGRG